MIERHAQVLHQCYLTAGLVVEGYHLVENGEVACLLDICHRSEDEPAGVVVEASADVVVAALGERLVLVVATAVGELGGGDVDDALARTLGYLVDKPHKVLVGVAESHAAANAALKERGGARHAECHHALILVPDVHHPVEFLVAGVDDIDVEQGIPIVVELAEGCVHLLRRVESCDGVQCLLLVDDLGSDELLVLLILHIAEHEDKVLALARLKFHLNKMGGNGAPAMCMAVARTAFHHCVGTFETIVEADEGLSVGVETIYRHIDAVVGIMVAALTVFCLVIDDRTLYLYFAGGEVALEVLHVGSCVPQTPLLK